MTRKINYPNNRRSPVRHRVAAHTRDGVKVGGYTRGSRKPMNKSKVVRGEKWYNVSTEGEPEAWDVTFKYSDGKKEQVTVIAASYEDAMDEAFEERKRLYEKPTAVTIVDPGLWGAIKGVIKGGAKRGKFKVKKYLVMGLVRDAYAEDKVRRVAARITLKQEYPEIFNLCDFSRERTIS